MLFKVCLEKDCIDGWVIHELCDTFPKKSDEIKITKKPSTKMSISFNSYASLSYWSCCSKCVLKKTASMVAWSMSTVAPFSNRSDDIEMTKSPSIKMNTSCNIYVKYIYKSYGSKCLLKQTASLVVWSMSTWQLFKLDPTILKWPRILGPRWAYPSIFTQAELIDHVVRTGVRIVYEEQNGHSIFTWEQHKLYIYATQKKYSFKWKTDPFGYTVST